MTRDTFKAKGNPMPSNEQREAIGDEKVVAWQWRLVGEPDELWTACRREQAERVAGDPEWETRALIPQSAYAELAVDRDLWRSMATFEGKVSASVLDDLHTTQAQLAEERELRMSLESSWQQAEAQLAELRGRLEGLASEYAAEAERHLMHAANKDWAEWVRADHSSRASELNGAAREIRILAAADGGGK